jgi:hypothetical protein
VRAGCAADEDGLAVLLDQVVVERVDRSFGSPSSRLKPRRRLFIRTPVSPSATPEPEKSEWMYETIVPSPSATHM